MKILSLKLRGAIGIRKGLGVEEVEIDFRNFAPGLIALTGRNGSGKTTIMENLHPYRQMVSRDGSLAQHFFLKDSYRFLEFEYEGHSYQAKILIDALTGGSEAYLIKDGKPLNDGKLTTYDKALEELLGSAELFFNSVFSGQKSKGIAQLKPAERRKLFYELLNLDRYEAYCDYAKQNLSDTQSQLSELQGRLHGLDLNPGDIENNKLERWEAEKKLNNYTLEELRLQGEIEVIEKELMEAKYQQRILESQAAEVENTKAQIKSLDDELSKAKVDYSLRQAECTDRINAAQDQNDRARKILANKDKIEFSLQQIEDLTKKQSAAKDTHASLLKQLADLRSEYHNKKEKLNDAAKEIVAIGNIRKVNSVKLEGLKRDLARAIQDRGEIAFTPCDEVTGEACKFLKNAYISGNKVPELETQIARLESDLRSYEEEELGRSADLNLKSEAVEKNYKTEINAIQEPLRVCEQKLNEIQIELSELSRANWKKLQEEANTAESEIKLNEQLIESTKKIIDEITIAYANQTGKIKDQIFDFENGMDIELESKLISSKKQVLYWENLISGMKSELGTAAKMKTEVTAKIAALEAAQLEFVRKESEAMVVTKQIADVTAEVRDWAFLVKAFDKTGIPVLKLENSGIEVTSVANELLSMFENKFRIVLETTALTKDKKKQKETFDINIVEDDGVTEISNKSGGQQVWLETAIQLAISQVVRKQGRNIQTSFLDEKDGALDLENAANYIAMIQRAHELSGVHNTFVITHRSELLDLISQQVKLTDGYLEVVNE